VSDQKLQLGINNPYNISRAQNKLTIKNSPKVLNNMTFKITMTKS